MIKQGKQTNNCLSEHSGLHKLVPDPRERDVLGLYHVFAVNFNRLSSDISLSSLLGKNIKFGRWEGNIKRVGKKIKCKKKEKLEEILSYLKY